MIAFLQPSTLNSQPLLSAFQVLRFPFSAFASPQPLNSSTPQRLFGMEASASPDMRVLIADDERDVGRSLADLVRICNHQIVGVVASGLEAIHAYNRFHPDVVLMDYRMPKLKGATACRNIRSNDP